MADPEPGGVAPIWRTSASRARQIVVSGGAEATVRVWDLESGESLHQQLRGHDGDVNTLALGELRGRAIVASGGDDRTVRLWDLASGESLGAALLGHRRKVRAVAIGEFGGRPLVVSGSDDNTGTPEPVTAGAPASSMPSPGPGPSMRPGVQPPSREARREPWWPTALVGLLFSVMLLRGLVLVVFAVRDPADLVNPPSPSRHAHGVVIRVDTVTCGSGSNKGTCHHPVVRFVTAARG